MSEIPCLTLPIKTSSSLEFDKRVRLHGFVTKWDPDTLSLLTTSRAALCKAFEGCNSKNPPTTESVENLAEDYLRRIGPMLPGCVGEDGMAVKLRKMVYYYWGASFGPATSYADNDSLYEAASVIANLGLLDLAAGAKRVQESNRCNCETAEKDAYRIFSKAAGKFDLAQKMMIKVADNPGMPLDIRPEVLDGLKSLALGQAQEFGLSVAAGKDDNRGKELLAKLAAQAHHLYDLAGQALPQAAAALKDEKYSRLLAYVSAKRQLMLTKAHMFNAAYLSKVDRTPEGLRAAQQAVDFSKVAMKLVESSKPVKSMLLPLASSVDDAVQRMFHKVKRENEIVSSRRPMPDEVPLPAPQVLARPTPFPLPPAHDMWSPEIVEAFELK